MTAKIVPTAAKNGRPHRPDLALLQSPWRPRSRFPIVRRPTKAESASGSPGSLEAWRPRHSSPVGRWRIFTTIPPYRPAPTSRRRVEFTLGRVPANVTVNANLNLNVNATGNLGLVLPSYVFATPVLGGQASVSLLAAYGVVGTTLAGTLSGVATGPLGNNVPFARSDTISDTTWGFGDLAPMFQLKWNAGVNNFMTYVTGDIPVGAYQSTRLSNIGIGHGAFNAGGGYTYFNPQTGHEFSGVLGFTYNFVNTSTQYQSGVDMHFDWGASQFLTKQVQVGLVGYISTRSSAATAAQATVSDAFSPRCLASGHSSATCFRSVKACRVTSTSRVTENLVIRLARPAGIPG